MTVNVKSLKSSEQFLTALEQLRSAIEDGRLTLLSGNVSNRRLSSTTAIAGFDTECSMAICASWVQDAPILVGAAPFSTPTDDT
jgi:hypothetical protein